MPDFIMKKNCLFKLLSRDLDISEGKKITVNTRNLDPMFKNY